MSDFESQINRDHRTGQFREKTHSEASNVALEPQRHLTQYDRWRQQSLSQKETRLQAVRSGKVGPRDLDEAFDRGHISMREWQELHPLAMQAANSASRMDQHGQHSAQSQSIGSGVQRKQASAADRSAASSRFTPAERFEELQKLDDWRVQFALAANHTVPGKVVAAVVNGAAKYRGDNTHRILSAAARNPNARIETLRSLSRRSEYEEAALSNPALEPLIPRALSRAGKDPGRRMALAANPKIGPREQGQLSSPRLEKDWRVRAALAKNPAAGIEALNRLTRDPNAQVQSLARAALTKIRVENEECIAQWQEERRGIPSFS